jgi:hypothetical protein
MSKSDIEYQKAQHLLSTISDMKIWDAVTLIEQSLGYEFRFDLGTQSTDIFEPPKDPSILNVLRPAIVSDVVHDLVMNFVETCSGQIAFFVHDRLVKSGKSQRLDWPTDLAPIVDKFLSHIKLPQ